MARKNLAGGVTSRLLADLLADVTETKWKAKKNEDVACNLARGKPGEQMSINKEGVVADSCC